MSALKVLLIAEGPSEFGCLDNPYRSASGDEGYFPPMLRKVLDRPLAIDAQSVMRIGRFDQKAKLKGHADRAASALLIASQYDYELLVFVKDVDRAGGEKKSAHERKRKLQKMHLEIEDGFTAVHDATHVTRVKATPCRMIEAWALGDSNAIAKVRDKRAPKIDVPTRPEELWGDDRDPRSSHPKRVLARALGHEPTAHDFENLARESDPSSVHKACPESFGPFLDELTLAAASLTPAPASSRPKRSRGRSRT